MNRIFKVLGLIGCVIFVLLLPALAQSESEVQAVREHFEEGDPGMQAWFREAYGYAVFPSVGKGGFGIGGAHGKGLVYEQGNLVGRSTLTQLTIGFQFGGQAFSEVIFFKNKQAFDHFTQENFEFGAQVSAVALTAGISADLDYSGGVAIVTAPKGGLMYEASIGGQKFSFQKIKDQ
ncbi:MAG: YSC84-related protein [Candidatus Aminicenantaceae bacterium]